MAKGCNETVGSKFNISQDAKGDDLSDGRQANQDASEGDRCVIPYPGRLDFSDQDKYNSGFAAFQMAEDHVNYLTMGKDEEEGHIIAAVLEGDLSEFRILVQRYQKPVYNMIWRVTRQTMTAEDLTQESFTRAYEKLHTFKTGRRFFPWLYTIAVNLCRDHVKRKGISNELFAEAHENGEWSDPNRDDCAKKPDCVLEVRQIAEAMDQLPMRYSEPMLLFYREGFSIKEISSALQISVPAVKVRIHRGRNLLTAQIGGSHDGS